MLRKRLIVLFAIVLLSAVALAKRKPLPPPDPEKGSIAISVTTRGGGTAYEVVFIRLDLNLDAAREKEMIRSTYAKYYQVFLLNAEPGRYVAVGAALRNSSSVYTEYGGFDIVTESLVFFDEEMIPKTEVTVVPGELTFAGNIRGKHIKQKKRPLDDTQEYYAKRYKPLTGPTSKRGWELKRITTDKESERRFWTHAIKGIFKKEPAWQELVQRKLKSLEEGEP